jgi:hypothetical protein
VLWSFFSQKALDNHKQFCKRLNYCNQIYILPEEGTKISFKNVKYQPECPFVIFADFEFITKPINEKRDEQPNIRNTNQSVWHTK